MANAVTRTGGCLCGAVRYQVLGEPIKSGLCHCADCRKITGTSFLAYADWKRTDFSSSGEIREFAGRSFCPTCGSRLFSLSEEGVEIFLGSLDEAPNDIGPMVEGWAKRREHWLPELLTVPRFNEDPSKL